ncbi:MAG: zf-HC2 domain-containing protein [Chloroflexi bacterium]|nr:zf-HC2 domain-containing protein [Chloroflexota bacterium]
MTCDRRVLSYYRDCELSPEERYEVDRHLSECAECTSALRGNVRLAQTIRSLPVETPPPTLQRDVWRAIYEQELSRRHRTPLGGLVRTFGPAVAAASLAVSVMVAFRPGAVEAPSQPIVVAPAASESSARVAAVNPSAGRPPAPANPSTDHPAAPDPAVRENSAVAGDVKEISVPAVTGNPVVTGRDALADAPSPPLKPPFQVSAASSDLLAPGSPTQSERAVPGPIARLYNANAQVREMLGAAAPGSKTVTLLEQSFQGGLAIWRSDTRDIYVLRRQESRWTEYQSGVQAPGVSSLNLAPPPGALVPTGGFGTLWFTRPEVKARLGWAVYEPRGSGGTVQTFEHGVVIWSPHGLLYVLTDDGHWRTFADAASV